MFSFKKKYIIANYTAFTLIELLVWIWIITLIIIWTSSIDYNRLNSKQKLEIFTNNIKSDFETIRNNSLTWRWIIIWSDLKIPEKWKIEYSENNSWTIIASIYDWINWEKYNEIKFENWYEIWNIQCWLLNGTSLDDLDDSWTWVIEFNWSNLNLSLEWDFNCDPNDKILHLIIKNNINSEILEINTINWLIEIKK